MPTPAREVRLKSRPLGMPDASNFEVVSVTLPDPCLLYTSDAADERSSVDLGGRRIIKKQNRERTKHQPDAATHNRHKHSSQADRKNK